MSDPLETDMLEQRIAERDEKIAELEADRAAILLDNDAKAERIAELEAEVAKLVKRILQGGGEGDG